MFGAFLDAAMSIPQMMHNEEMQNDAQLFNRGEAIEQRQWMERMTSSAYQRAAKDAEAAGLNRILAMRQGGADAGGGASASSSSSPGQVRSNFMGGEINSAQIANLREDTRLKEKQVSLTHLLGNTATADYQKRVEETATQRALTEKAEAEASIASSSAKGAKLEGGIDETKYGEIMRYIDRAIKAITGGSSAIRNTR